MNYQNVLCIGDSQTFGARTYGCYPLYLAIKLNECTGCHCRAINWSLNGLKCRDVWFMLNDKLGQLSDCYQACLLIGTNDVGDNVDLEIFTEYYRQCLIALCISGIRNIYCAQIPPIFPNGHAFFDQGCLKRREQFNEAIKQCVDEMSCAYLVNLDGLSVKHYEDPVHFNEAGNKLVAECFAKVIKER